MIISIYSTQVIDTRPDLDRYGGLELVMGLLTKYIDEETEHTVYLFATENSYVPKKADSYLFSVGKAGTDPIMALKEFWRDERSRKALMESDICLDASWGYYLYAPGIYEKLKNVAKSWHGPDPGWKEPPKHVKKPNLIAVGFNIAKYLSEVTGYEWRAVHNGIDLSRYKYNPKPISEREYLVWLSRLYPPKGAHEAIRIANKLEIPIHIVGGSFGDPGNYVNLIKKMCEESKYATFHGEVSHEKKVELLRNAKAVILPIIEKNITSNGRTYIWREPMGIVGIEANACGTPFIVRPSYGWTETLIHGYNGFHANSIEEFKYYIERVDEIKPENCRRIAEHFNYKRMAKEYLKLFEEILAGRKW